MMLFILAIISMVVIAYNTSLVWNLSSDGFNFFISAFRFPLGILTLVIPIVALLAANHRSEQTKEQIRITGLQNYFSNYYKHLEEFVKYADNASIGHDIDFRYVHKKLYPNSQSGNYSICPILMDLLNEVQKIPCYLYDKYPSDVSMDCLDDDYKSYVELLNKIAIYLDERPGKYAPERDLFGSYNSTYLVKSMGLLDKTIEICKLIEKLCSFSMDFESRTKKLVSSQFQVSDFGISKNEDTNRNIYDFSSDSSFKKANEHFKESLDKMKLTM